MSDKLTLIVHLHPSSILPLALKNIFLYHHIPAKKTQFIRQFDIYSKAVTPSGEVR